MTDYRTNQQTVFTDNGDGTVTFTESPRDDWRGVTVPWTEVPLDLPAVQQMATAYAADLAAADALDQLRADAQLLLSDMATHAQLPLADPGNGDPWRDPESAALLDARAGALLVSALGVEDPALTSLTGKINALALRLTRERDAYEEGLL